jgi:hypothetical protein
MWSNSHVMVSWACQCDATASKTFKTAHRKRIIYICGGEKNGIATQKYDDNE